MDHTILHGSGSSLHTRFCHLFKEEIVHMFSNFSNSQLLCLLPVRGERIARKAVNS